MQQDAANQQGLEVIRETCISTGITFDSERMTLKGFYRDELSAYRARKRWSDALSESFLLESGHDFVLSVRYTDESQLFMLHCEFLSACGRYAFWRLTNNQSPETQYLIETAHIPDSENHYMSLLNAPELAPVDQAAQRPAVFAALEPISSPASRLFGRLRAWLTKSFRR